MRPLIIGIAGGSGCGKSTLCGAIERQLADKKVLIIHMDEYYKNPLPQMTSPITQCVYDDRNHPDSVDYEKPLNLIKSLQSGCTYDVVIVDGAFLYCYDEMCSLFDLKVFIELDADERMYRRIKRNTDNFKENIDFHADYYLNFAKYQEQQFALPSKVYADIVLNGNRLDGMALDVLLAWIKTKIS